MLSPLNSTELGALDGDELLHVALDAMRGERLGEALCMLKAFLLREPEHVHAGYLLAALHAQLGMRDRALGEFKAIVERDPGFALARFQWGQLLLETRQLALAKEVLAALDEQGGSLAAYARALCALAEDRPEEAVQELSVGLELPQPAHGLAERMRVLLGQLLSVGAGQFASRSAAEGEAVRGVERAQAGPTPSSNDAAAQDPSYLASYLLQRGYGHAGSPGARANDAASEG